MSGNSGKVALVGLELMAKNFDHLLLELMISRFVNFAIKTMRMNRCCSDGLFLMIFSEVKNFLCCHLELKSRRKTKEVNERR